MTSGQLADRSVIITGAASGIGRRAAQRFAEAGARVALADINLAGASAAAEELPGAIAVGVDIRDLDSVRAMVEQVTSTFEGIDVLVNNAMVCGRSRLLDASVEELRTDFEVNLLGPFLCCQQVLPVMLAAERGVIINVSSVNGLTHLGNEAYSAAKAGTLALTRAIALDYGGQGIRCNAVAPGTVRTEVWDHRLANDPQALDRAARFYPTGRVGEPDDIADALIFLASDASSWISGVTLPVDGGLLAGNLAMARGITDSD